MTYNQSLNENIDNVKINHELTSGGSGSSVSDITLALANNSDNDPIINLSYKEDGTEKNSPVSFNKEDFEISNNHLHIKSKLKHKDIDVASTTQFYNMYFGNYDITNEPFTFDKVKSIFILSSSANAGISVVFLSDTIFRVYSATANVNVKVRVIYED